MINSKIRIIVGVVLLVGSVYVYGGWDCGREVKDTVPAPKDSPPAVKDGFPTPIYEPPTAKTPKLTNLEMLQTVAPDLYVHTEDKGGLLVQYGAYRTLYHSGLAVAADIDGYYKRTISEFVSNNTKLLRFSKEQLEAIDLMVNADTFNAMGILLALTDSILFKLDHLSVVEIRGLLAELTAPFPEHEPYLTLCYEISVADD